MPAAPLPDDEADRLAHLHALALLDSPPDPRFDAMVRLAAAMHHVPIAMVSLVDRDRQWFKSSVGLAVQETSRDAAFCAYAILDPDHLLIVEDAVNDPRFADNPLVVGPPGIRFYAGAPIRGASGHALGTLCVIDTEPRHFGRTSRKSLADMAVAVSAFIELYEKLGVLEREATTDTLTSIGNRASFEQRLDAAVAAARDGVPQALIFIDLDGFKLINETHGHAMGDAVLQAVAQRIRQSVRTNDSVSRFGGDEFVVLAPDVRSHAVAAGLTRRIRQALAMKLHITLPDERGSGVAGVTLDIGRIDASFGVALCPLDAPDRGGLLRAANLALYRAKRSGGSHVDAAVDAAGCGGGASEPGEVGRELKRDLLMALSRDQPELWWQPYVTLATGEVAGCEALFRWERQGYGNVAPATLLPFVEANGLNATLDEWVLCQACTAAANWAAPKLVSVNLSAGWFGEDDVEALVARALRRSGLKPERLCIELTEHTLIVNRTVAQDRMRRLHGLGVRLALDDFGTGSSSLAYLQYYPFNTIKLDRAFVEPLGRDTRAEAVTRGIIRLGHELGAAICAEGIETPQQLSFLYNENCDRAQGYLLAKPLAVPVLDNVSRDNLMRAPKLKQA